MNTRLSAMATLMVALGAAGCADEAKDADASNPDSDASKSPQRAESRVSTLAATPETCARDEAGQIACLVDRFDVNECGDAKILGSMFRENKAEVTFQHRTAYGLDQACIAELREAATGKNLRENDRGEFVLKRGDGYRESLIIGLQISSDGSVVEWERVQE